MKPTECEVGGIKYVAIDSPAIYGCDGCEAEFNEYLCCSIESESCEFCLKLGEWSVIWIKKEPQ